MGKGGTTMAGLPQKFITGKERFFGNDELIVSKTDIPGRITYANDVFQRLAGYTEQELLGAPHSIIRHPFMPRAVFKLLWDTLAEKKEIFAYVLNKSKNGDHYWVFAHVTPSFDSSGSVVAYHSNRRVPDPKVIEQTIIPLYTQLLEIEAKEPNQKQGMMNAFAAVVDLLKQKGVSYEELIFSLQS